MHPAGLARMATATGPREASWSAPALWRFHIARVRERMSRNRVPVADVTSRVAI